MLTTNYERVEGWVKKVNGKKAPEHLIRVRIPPAWVDVQVDPDPDAVVIAVGFDEAGRKQRLYSLEHKQASKNTKFIKVRSLLSEWEDIHTQIEIALNDPEVVGKEYEAYLVAYLIFNTGIRPGSISSAHGENSQEGTAAFGATTLQLKHVKPCTRGVRLQFVGKKGVKQNILVTEPFLVETIKSRKHATTAYSTLLFDVSSTKLCQVFRELGSGDYTAKDFRTAIGTSIALEIFEKRQRWPKTKKGVKEIVNETLDKVAKQLGNTRSVSKNSYIDPAVLEEFVPKS